MRLVFYSSFFFAVLGFSQVAAEIVEIPLPELHGPYPFDGQFTRTVTIELDTVPTIIHGASFRLGGTATVGAVECEWGGPYPWTMDLSAHVADAFPTADFWYASSLMPDEDGSFQWTAEFRSSRGGATWDFLLDGIAEVELMGIPAILVGLCWPVSGEPEAIIDEAVLLIDAEFALPVESNTWGRIKALFGCMR